MKWSEKKEFPEDAYFDELWHLEIYEGYVIIKRKDNQKYYISNGGEDSDKYDEGPYDTLHIATTIYRMTK